MRRSTVRRLFQIRGTAAANDLSPN